MDWSSVALQVITALTPVVTLVAVWGLKLAWSKIPAAWIFIAAPLAGMVVNYALTWISGHSGDYSAMIAAALGLLAVVLREFLTTLASKGLIGSVSVTKSMF